MHAKLLQSRPTLCDPIVTQTLWPSPPSPDSSVHGDSLGKNTGVDCHVPLQGSSWPRDQTLMSCIGRWVLYHECTTWEAPLETWISIKNDMEWSSAHIHNMDKSKHWWSSAHIHNMDTSKHYSTRKVRCREVHIRDAIHIHLKSCKRNNIVCCL